MALDHVIDLVFTHGDLGHLALLAWALTATGSGLALFKEIKAANRRFDLFVRELHAFNRLVLGDED